MQDDVNSAIGEQSAQWLSATLRQFHPCATEKHAIHEAVRQAHVPALRMLLESRADPNVRCPCLERGCEFPLQLAVSSATFFNSADRLQAIDLLLRAGVQTNLHRYDAEANTPLHDASRRGDLEVVKKLLRHSANPNAKNSLGETPLHLVVEQGMLPGESAGTMQAIALVLLRAGASPHVLPGVLAVHPRMQALIEQWSAWWRCRFLAWIRSRGRTSLNKMMPEIFVNIASF